MKAKIRIKILKATPKACLASKQFRRIQDARYARDYMRLKRYLKTHIEDTIEDAIYQLSNKYPDFDTHILSRGLPVPSTPLASKSSARH